MLTTDERRKVLETYHMGWAAGTLKQAISNEPGQFDGPYSVQQFFQDLWSDPRYAGAFMELRADTTFASYMRQGLKLGGDVVPLRDPAMRFLCRWPLDWTIWEALVPPGTSPDEVDRVRKVIKDGAVTALAPEVWNSILERYGAVPVIDFFRVVRDEDGWFEWFSASFGPNRSGRQHGVREWVLATEFGPVTLKLARQEFSEDVNAYEWEATLRGGNDQVWCRAVGSAYVLKPFTALSGLDFFMEAENMCEHDAAMVFDLPWWEDGLEESAAFVWIWERHPTAPPGSGVACVEAALKQLKRSYRGLTQLVVDARPRQWAYFGCGDEPPALAQMRQNAVEQIEARIDFGRLCDALGPRTELSLVYPSLDNHPLGVETQLIAVAAAAFG